MASPSLLQFVERLSESGLMSADDIKAIRALLDDVSQESRPQDSEQLAKLLVRQKKLTPFQAQQIYAGKTKGLVMGNYLVLDKLGQGGMGVVLKAQHRRMGRLVALKVMASSAMKSPDFVKRFHREVQAAARLTHPNIVIAHDADEANGTHFLVMEYVEGKDLNEVVKKQGPMTVEQAVSCIVQAAKGLEFAHQQGIIHRDIKPANLLLDQSGTVKILDMGLARFEGGVGESAEAAGLTNTGSIMGTVDYMSPEQAMDTKHADARSDIYSLGCSLYFLLTGKVMYGGDTVMKRLMAHQSSSTPVLDLKTPQGVDQQVWQRQVSSLNSVFQQMVAKQSGSRLQTMGEVILELEKVLSGDSPAALAGVAGDQQEPELDLFLRSLGGGAAVLSQQTANQVTRLDTNRITAQEQDGDFYQDTFISTSESGTETMLQPTRVESGTTRRPPPRIGLVAGGAGVFLLLAFLGTWIIFRDKDGNETARVLLPEGGSIAAQTDSKSPPQNILLPAVGNPTVGNNAVPVIPAVWQPNSEQQAFFDSLKPLSDSERLSAVKRKLLEIHPGTQESQVKFDPHGESGLIVWITFPVEKVAPWPVRGVGNLKAVFLHNPDFKYDGNWTSARTVDLSSLQGLPLELVGFNGLNAGSLVPLEGMKLKELSFAKSNISDLSPLKGMPLEVLEIFGNPVSDLTALAGMPLKRLMAASTQINDLSPLQDCSSLQRLEAGGTRITDLMPISKLPIQYLAIGWTSIKDISALKPMSLKTIWLDHTKIVDLSPLAQAPLVSMNIIDTLVVDLSPLRQMPLERLTCNAALLESQKELLAEIKSLQTVNGQPTQQLFGRQQFWSPSPEQKAFFDDVAKLSAAEQFEAVQKKLKEVNSLDDETKFSHQVQNNRVVSFDVEFLAESFDLWPLRALEHLKSLNCKVRTYHYTGSHRGKWKPSGIQDLRPLVGLPLETLKLQGNAITDLTPLKQMPLRHLDISGTAISDLSPLQGMSLTHLLMFLTQVTDLTPLSDVPVEVLWIAFNEISDISPLQGGRLRQIDMGHTRVSDLSPLTGLPLVRLAIGHCPVVDLSPVKAAPLERVDLSGVPVADLSPLIGKPLTVLDLQLSSLTDIESLKQIESKSLSISADVADLTLLQGKMIERLWCHLRLFDEASEQTLRSLPLKSLNGAHNTGQPVEEFWQQFEANRKSAREFAEQTPRLPVSEQVLAVAERLKQLNTDRIEPLECEIKDDVVSSVRLTLNKGIVDLSPLLAFSQLKHLTLEKSARANDLSVLPLLSVEELNCETQVLRENIVFLQKTSSLKIINGQPAAEVLSAVSQSTRP